MSVQERPQEVDFRRFSTGELTVRTVLHWTVATLQLSGELDFSGRERAEQALRDLEGDRSLSLIIVDLGQLSFIDSTGIAWLLAASERSRADSSRLRVTRSTPAVERVLRLTGVSERLPYLEDTYPNTSAA
jgi:anti-anti-sigma factor